MSRGKPGDASGRLLAVAAIVAESPGISLEELKDGLAGRTGREWAQATLFGDIRKLRAAGLIAPGTRGDGYYPPGPAFARSEVRTLLGAMRALAVNLGSPLCKDKLALISRRLARNRRLDLLDYPAEALAHRVVLDTSDDDYIRMVRALEAASRAGRQVAITKTFHPWEQAAFKESVHVVVPLQLLFFDGAWYLLAEEAADNQFRVFRLDRLAPDVALTSAPARGLASQRETLAEARSLLDLAWGVMLPPRGTPKDSPELERSDVQFSEYAAQFIGETVHRHPTQRTRRNGDGLLFSVRLHPVSHQEFCRWVFGWGEHACLLRPAGLRKQIADRFKLAAARYL